MELGGKSPNIVFADADFETAVDNALTAAFTHSGQVCSAGCRAIVQDEIYDRFVAEVGRRADLIRLGGGIDDADRDRRAHHRRSTAPRSRATSPRPRREGARLVAGGRRPDEPELQAGFFYRPTVFADVDRDMRIVREEVFGPVLTIERFIDRGRGDRARQRHDLRAGRRGLDRRRRRAPSGSPAGSATGPCGSTTTTRTCPQAEWGGFKQSGIGGNLARAVWTSTVRPSTSGRTRHLGPRAGSEGDDR